MTLYLTDSSGIFADRRLADLLNRTESMPSIAEPERFSFWVYVPEIESLQICFNYKKWCQSFTASLWVKDPSKWILQVQDFKGF